MDKLYQVKFAKICGIHIFTLVDVHGNDTDTAF